MDTRHLFRRLPAARLQPEWEIPAETNHRFGGLPVNPKVIKHRTLIGLGLALRQYDIDEPFILRLGAIGNWTARRNASLKSWPRAWSPHQRPQFRGNV